MIRYLIVISLIFCLLNGCDQSSEKLVESGYVKVANEIIEKGNTAIASYKANDGSKTGDFFGDLYFDVFEASGMEMEIGEKSIDEKVELESYFSIIISAAMRRAPLSELQKPWFKLKKRLIEIAPTLGEMKKNAN